VDGAKDFSNFGESQALSAVLTAGAPLAVVRVLGSEEGKALGNERCHEQKKKNKG
jgi:hypothetical protein